MNDKEYFETLHTMLNVVLSVFQPLSLEECLPIICTVIDDICDRCNADPIETAQLIADQVKIMNETEGPIYTRG